MAAKTITETSENVGVDESELQNELENLSEVRTAFVVEMWARRLFDAIDAMDMTAFLRFLDPDVRFQFGNWPAAVGRDATNTLVGNFFLSLRGLSHEVTGITVGSWNENGVRGAVVSAELLVTYSLPDGRVLPPLPAVSVLRLRPNTISIADYRVFMDVNPVFAPAEENAAG